MRVIALHFYTGLKGLESFRKDVQAIRRPLRAEAQQLFQQHLQELSLHELRNAQQLSQQSLAKALNINQAAVSKMERRTDRYISTLRDSIRAMGGRAGDHCEVSRWSAQDRQRCLLNAVANAWPCTGHPAMGHSREPPPRHARFRTGRRHRPFQSGFRPVGAVAFQRQPTGPRPEGVS